MDILQRIGPASVLIMLHERGTAVTWTLVEIIQEKEWSDPGRIPPVI